MKSSTVFSLALLGFAAASPIASPQDIDFDSYDNTEVLPDLSAPVGAVAPPPVSSYIPSVAASAAAAAATAVGGDLTKRDEPCSAQPIGNGPSVVPDTDGAFTSNPYFASIANSAKIPSGYFLAYEYQNLQASASNPSYLTYISDSLTSYDPGQCAIACNAISGCVSFNIYFERDPSLYLDSVNCPTSSSVTRIKCAFFGSAITTADATNVGQYQDDFHVVIAGSNTYTTAPQPLPGFTGPVFLNNASINSPTSAGTYMGVQTFPGNQPFDPSVCAAACNQKSAYNTRHAAAGASPRICQSFDAYILYKNSINGLFTCTYYTQAYDTSYATNFGQYNSHGDHYTIRHSYTYSLN